MDTFDTSSSQSTTSESSDDDEFINILNWTYKRQKTFKKRTNFEEGFFSINTQVVCDSSMKILDINARQELTIYRIPIMSPLKTIFRWPGSCHDQSVFNFCRLRARLESREFENCLLIGDAGYEGESLPKSIDWNKSSCRKNNWCVEKTVSSP